MFYAWRLVKQELVLNTNKLCVDSKKTSAFQNTIFTPVISPLKNPLRSCMSPGLINEILRYSDRSL